MFKLKFAAGTMAALLSFSAHSLVISSEYGLPLVESTTEVNETGFLDLFDASLGTLTGAVLSIFGSATQSFSVTNNAAQSQTANVTSSVNLLWSSSLTTDPLVGLVQSFSLTTGFVTYEVGETISYGPDSDDRQDIFMLGAMLNNVTGSGQFSVNCESLSGLAVRGGGGNLFIPQSSTAGCGARIVYTYDEEPPATVSAPGAVALIGLCLAGLGWSRRKAA